MSIPAKTLREELEAFRARCFWWVPKSVAIMDLSRPTLLEGLQHHGGWAGMRLAARL